MLSSASFFFVIITSIIFWAVVLFTAWRVICAILGKENWAGLPKILVQKFGIWVLQEKSGFNTCVKIILFGIFIRILMLVMAWWFIPSGDNIADIFRSFNRWDAPHYLNLAEYGYGFIWNDATAFVVFFPLYPWLVRLFSVVIGNYMAAAFFVSFASYLAAMCYLYFLVRIDFKASVAWWAVILISVFPTSFFFGTPHTESIFILTTTATLYYIRKHNWLLAGVFGAFASLSRMAGIVLIGAAIVELIMQQKLSFRAIADMAKKGFWILLMPIGTVTYLILNWHVAGDPFAFTGFQASHWHQGYLYFGRAMDMQFEYLVLPWGSGDISLNYIHLTNILAFAFSICIITYAAIKRFNAGQTVYLLGYTFVSFSLAWLMSGGRYVAASVPLFIFLAEYVEKKAKRKFIFVMIFLFGLVLFLREYVLGGFIM